MPASSTCEATATGRRQAFYHRPSGDRARGHCQVSAGYWMDFSDRFCSPSFVPTSNLGRWTLEVIPFCGANINALP